MANGGMRIVRISRELLLQVLRLPPGTEVVDFSRDAYFAEDVFALKVTHPDFPAEESGRLIPTADPTYRRVGGVTEFVGWNGLGGCGADIPIVRGEE